MERGDDMWYVSRWLDEVLTLSSEKRDPPHLKRKRTDGTSNVFYLTVKLCGEKEEDEEDSNGMEDITSDLKETERGKYSCTWPINNVESNKHKHLSLGQSVIDHGWFKSLMLVLYYVRLG